MAVSHPEIQINGSSGCRSTKARPTWWLIQQEDIAISIVWHGGAFGGTISANADPVKNSPWCYGVEFPIATLDHQLITAPVIFFGKRISDLTGR